MDPAKAAVAVVMLVLSLTIVSSYAETGAGGGLFIGLGVALLFVAGLVVPSFLSAGP